MTLSEELRLQSTDAFVLPSDTYFNVGWPVPCAEIGCDRTSANATLWVSKPGR